MYEREKAIIITNNDRVFEAYKDEMQVILKQTYEEVLIATRDMVYDRQYPADTSAGIEPETESDAISVCNCIPGKRGRCDESNPVD